MRRQGSRTGSGPVQEIRVTKELTRGDASNAAATGGRSTIPFSEISTGAPMLWRPDMAGEFPVGDALFTLTGANVDSGIEQFILPLENPSNAYATYRLAPYLEPIIQAIVDNVFGSGFTLEPVIDIDDPGADKIIRECLEYQKAKGDFEEEVAVTDAEVEKERTRIRIRMAREKIFLEAWFRNACPDMSYHLLCQLMGQDEGVTGSGYWEVVRGVDGKPSRLIWVPSWSIRAKPQDGNLIAYKVPAQETLIHWGVREQVRRFRSYVQINSSKQVVARYKEFGDPRVMSRRSGKYYASIEEMNKVEFVEYKNAAGETVREPVAPATEILDFKIPYSGSTAYGKPRWTANYPDLVGGRDVAEQNRLVITDQDIPNMIILLAGPRVEEADVARMEEKIASRRPGEKSVMILRATTQKRNTPGPTHTPQMEIIKTRDVQNTDGLGLNYSKETDRKLRRHYRMPKVALGDDEGTNRATAFAMFQLVEQQTYDPERVNFGDRVTTTLLVDLSIHFWRYAPRSRAPKDPALLAQIISSLASSGILTPDEGRNLSEQIFNQTFKDLDGVWTKLPIAILQAILQTKNQATAAAILSPTDGDFLASLRKAVLQSITTAGLDPGGPPEGKPAQTEESDDSDPAAESESDEQDEVADGETSRSRI